MKIIGLKHVTVTTPKVMFSLFTIFLWILITLYWIISARKIGKEHRGNEVFSFIKLIGSALVIYLPLLIGGFIAGKLFTTTSTIGIIGLVLCSIGIGVMVRAREYLGRNWSGNVIIQQEHSLTKNGPYKYVRHPIYSGSLLAMFASAMVVGQIFGFIWVLFCTFGLAMKIKKEEVLLTQQFPDKYPQYKVEVKKLIPFIW